MKKKKNKIKFAERKNLELRKQISEMKKINNFFPNIQWIKGILMCFVAGTYMDWSQLAFLGGSLPIPFLLLMLIIPETPRWYVSKDRAEDARKALKWLRGKQADVEPELKGIIKTHTDSERHASSNGLMQLLRRNNLKPLSVSLGLMFFQQFSGINAVIFYAEKIFIYAGSTLPSSVCTIILGIVNFIATFVATVLIDRLGRKVRMVFQKFQIFSFFTENDFFFCRFCYRSCFIYRPLV